MRQLKMLALTALLSLSMFSCSDSNGPEATAEKFINLVNNGQFAEAKKISTERTASFLSMSESMLGDKIDAMADKNKNLTVEIVSTVESDNTAKVFYKVVGGPEGKEQQLDLVKVGNEWKADINMGM